MGVLGLSKLSTEQKEDKRGQILRAAVTVFARKGFHHSRISEIAEEAGVASGTIYLYFRNKDDILISVFEESLDRITKKIGAEMAAVDDPRAKLHLFIERHLGLLTEHKELSEVLQVELRQSHKFMKEYEPVRWVEYINLIAGVLRDGQRSGVFRKDLSLGIFKRAVFGALDEIALHAIMTGKSARGEEFLRQAADQLTAIVIEGALSETGRRQPLAARPERKNRRMA
jgi:TetR/AcrR family transcriptional regulator, fatty acid metabolism regulator protein